MNEGKNNRERIDLSGALKDSDTGVKFQEYRKDEKQASYAILGLVAVAIIIAIIFVASGGSSQPTPGTIPEDQFVP